LPGTGDISKILAQREIIDKNISTLISEMSKNETLGLHPKINMRRSPKFESID
jgi:hypothetical protein